MALHTALAAPGSLSLIVSPSLRQSQESFRRVAALAQANAQAVPLEARSALRLELANRSRIISLPGAEGTIRGYAGVQLVVLDEAARVPDDVFYTVTPMVAVSAGRQLLLSTPHGQQGFFYETWAHGEAWEKVQVTAAECPRISAAFLAEEQRSMPDYVFASEYECRFVQTEAHVFRLEDLYEMMDPSVEPWPFSSEVAHEQRTGHLWPRPRQTQGLRRVGGGARRLAAPPPSQRTAPGR